MSHIIVPDAERCAFCDYLSGARPFTVLRREPLAAVFVTREQRGVSHVLVVPTRHAPTIVDLQDDEAVSVMSLIRRSAYALDCVEKRPGISIWQNNGVDANQLIPHLHFHVAGTVPGGSTEWDEVKELSVSETDLIAERLRPYMGIDAVDGR